MCALCAERAAVCGMPRRRRPGSGHAQRGIFGSMNAAWPPQWAYAPGHAVPEVWHRGPKHRKAQPGRNRRDGEPLPDGIRQ